jgi:predicted secreted protein
MTILGNDLIIYCNGKAIAGSKSCTIDVDAEMIKTASPTDGAWEHYLAGRKNWDISTNHIIKTYEAHDQAITCVGTSHSGISVSPAYVDITDLPRIQATSRGLNVATLRYSSSTGFEVLTDMTQYDTYQDSQAVTDLISFLTTAGQHDNIFVIVSYDAITITQDLKTAISNAGGIPLASIPVVSQQRIPFAAIGVPGELPAMKGVAAFGDISQSAYTRLLLNGDVPISSTPIRDGKGMVGQTLTISVAVNGLYADRLTGSAICKSFSVSGVKGSLMTGSFRFKGSGPLT